jgi:hypothetical protein
LVTDIRLPSELVCIMFGCTPGATVLTSFGWSALETSHC